MQTYISPIGFNTTSVTRALINQGVGDGDSVLLVRPTEQTDDNRGAEAVADVKQLLHEIAPTIAVDVERIPHDDFETAVMRCSDLIETAEGSVVISLSGGARDVLLPLTVAAIAHAQTIESTLGYSDIDGQVRQWLLPNITVSPSDGQRKTLTVIEKHGPEVSIAELTSKRETAKSTITRHVNGLESDGLVTAQTEDRSKHVSITLSGRLLLARSDL